MGKHDYDIDDILLEAQLLKQSRGDHPCVSGETRRQTSDAGAGAVCQRGHRTVSGTDFSGSIRTLCAAADSFSTPGGTETTADSTGRSCCSKDTAGAAALRRWTAGRSGTDEDQNHRCAAGGGNGR